MPRTITHILQPRLLLFLLLIAAIIPAAFSQVYKIYIRYDQQIQPDRFSLTDMSPVPDEMGVLIGGELIPEQGVADAFAYVIRLDHEGVYKQNTVLSMLSPAQGGLMSGGVEMSDGGNMYMGASTTSQFSGGAASAFEPTVSGLAPDGKLQWVLKGSTGTINDIVQDDFSDLVVAMGEASPGAPFQSDIIFSRVSPSGTFVDQVRFGNGLTNRPIELVDLPSDAGYLALAQYDTIDEKAPYVIMMDDNMNIAWAHYFFNPGLSLDPRDIAYHEEGFIYVTGTAFEVASQIQSAFLMILDSDGIFQDLVLYHIPTMGGMRGEGVSGFTTSSPPYHDGLIICGSYQHGNNVDQSAVVWSVDLDGNLNWVWDYSNLDGQEHFHDEIATQVVSLDKEDMFVVAGEVRSFHNGVTTHRGIWAAKASINDGEINYNGDCARKVPMISQHETLFTNQEGAIAIGGTMQNGGYPYSSLDFDGDYCSFVESPKLDNSDFLNTSIQENKVEIPANAVMKIFDMNGKLIFSGSQNAGLNLPQGLYVKTYIWEGEFVQEKFIVR